MMFNIISDFKNKARKSWVQALEIASGRNASTDSSEVVLHRAETLLSKNSLGNYKVFKNNCEDFAIYCKTGFNLHFGTGGFGASGQVAAFFSAAKVPVIPILHSALAHYILLSAASVFGA
ncbi:hypothetical protein FXO38_29700 [Capsicum annuum]|nr:hypothetical protein FXO38_29700 [Capsicum annuum]KAF3685508.1 hypothetical protein FXO37_00567 [Capsicum annuum]